MLFSFQNETFLKRILMFKIQHIFNQWKFIVQIYLFIVICDLKFFHGWSSFRSLFNTQFQSVLYSMMSHKLTWIVWWNLLLYNQLGWCLLCLNVCKYFTVWWHQKITWASVYLSSVWPSNINLRAISHKMPQLAITNISPKINLPGANELKFYYRQVSNIRRTFVGNQIVDHSDVIGASPVGAAPTTSSFST